MFRPQMFVAIITLGVMGIWGLRIESIETASLAAGGIIALGMKLLDIDSK